MSTGLTARSSRSTAAERAFRPAGGTADASAVAWPLSAHLPLGALPTAVPCARAYIRVILDEWGLAFMADSAELIVSELVTNSVKASADEHGRPRYSDDGLPVVHLRLACDRTCVLVEVWDSVPAPPAARRARPDEENGRGLALIQALSDRWGWTTVPGWPGKAVWAELRAGVRSRLLRRQRRPQPGAPVPGLRYLTSTTSPVGIRAQSRIRFSRRLLGKIRASGRKWWIMVHTIFPEAANFPDPDAPRGAGASRAAPAPHRTRRPGLG